MNLQYSLSGLPRDEFDEAHRLVQSMTAKKVQFRIVTDDMDRMRKSDQEYIGSHSKTWAICAPVREGVYDLWFNPELNPLSDFYRVTLLHELSHAYKHMQHGPPFKHFHGRAIYHYGDIVNPIENMDQQVLFMLGKYTKIKKEESYEDYSLRLKVLREDIRDAAELEYDRVRDEYGRVSL